MASEGGKSVSPDKRGFRVDRVKAAEAGRIGGRSVPAHTRGFALNRDLAVMAGSLGGIAKKMRDKDGAKT